MTIQLPNNFSQTVFDKWLKELQDKVLDGAECKLITLSGTLIVDGYWDIEADSSGAYDCPHFWYNKQELDKRNIKYGLDN